MFRPVFEFFLLSDSTRLGSCRRTADHLRHALYRVPVTGASWSSSVFFRKGWNPRRFLPLMGKRIANLAKSTMREALAVPEGLATSQCQQS